MQNPSEQLQNKATERKSVQIFQRELSCFRLSRQLLENRRSANAMGHVMLADLLMRDTHTHTLMLNNDTVKLQPRLRHHPAHSTRGALCDTKVRRSLAACHTPGSCPGRIALFGVGAEVQQQAAKGKISEPSQNIGCSVVNILQPHMNA